MERNKSMRIRAYTVTCNQSIPNNTLVAIVGAKSYSSCWCKLKPYFQSRSDYTIQIIPELNKYELSNKVYGTWDDNSNYYDWFNIIDKNIPDEGFFCIEKFIKSEELKLRNGYVQ